MLVLCLALSVAAAATRLLHTTHVQAAGITGRPCSTFIPKEWGEFRGASTYGMEFEDSDGTIRFVKNPPCDPSFNVRADLEIHRKK
jgi:hypothetical protein